MLQTESSKIQKKQHIIAKQDELRECKFGLTKSSSIIHLINRIKEKKHVNSWREKKHFDKNLMSFRIKILNKEQNRTS